MSLEKSSVFNIEKSSKIYVSLDYINSEAQRLLSVDGYNRFIFKEIGNSILSSIEKTYGEEIIPLNEIENVIMRLCAKDAILYFISYKNHVPYLANNKALDFMNLVEFGKRVVDYPHTFTKSEIFISFGILDPDFSPISKYGITKNTYNFGKNTILINHVVNIFQKKGFNSFVYYNGFKVCVSNDKVDLMVDVLNFEYEKDVIYFESAYESYLSSIEVPHEIDSVSECFSSIRSSSIRHDCIWKYCSSR